MPGASSDLGIWVNVLDGMSQSVTIEFLFFFFICWRETDAPGTMESSQFTVSGKFANWQNVAPAHQIGRFGLGRSLFRSPAKLNSRRSASSAAEFGPPARILRQYCVFDLANGTTTLLASNFP